MGKVYTEAFLANRISNLVMFFNIGKTMDNAQVSETVRLILADTRFTELRPEEFEYCFNQIKTGARGKLYDRIDGAIIFETLNWYLGERETTIYEMNRELQAKSDNTYTSVLGVLVDKGIKIEPKEMFKVAAEPIKLREKTKAEILANQFMQEFDALSKKQFRAGEKLPPIRFVVYQEKSLSIEDYMLTRLAELRKEEMLKKLQPMSEKDVNSLLEYSIRIKDTETTATIKEFINNKTA